MYEWLRPLENNEYFNFFMSYSQYIMLSEPRYFGSAIAHSPGYFGPWTFWNIELNMLPMNWFKLNFYFKLWYLTEEFQALQLIALVAFGTTD